MPNNSFHAPMILSKFCPFSTQSIKFLALKSISVIQKSRDKIDFSANVVGTTNR